MTQFLYTPIVVTIGCSLFNAVSLRVWVTVGRNRMNRVLNTGVKKELRK